MVTRDHIAKEIGFSHGLAIIYISIKEVHHQKVANSHEGEAEDLIHDTLHVGVFIHAFFHSILADVIVTYNMM